MKQFTDDIKLFIKDVSPIFVIIVLFCCLSIGIPSFLLSNKLKSNFQSESLLTGNTLIVNDIRLEISDNTVSVESSSVVDRNNMFPIISTIMCTNTNQWFYSVRDISAIQLANPMQEEGLVTSITNSELVIGNDKFNIVLETKNHHGAWPFVELDQKMVEAIKWNKIVKLNYKNRIYVYDFSKALETLYAHSNVCPK